MALIFSPLTEDVLEGPYQPFPKGVFVMLQQGKGISQLEAEMDRVVESVLIQRTFRPIRATSERGQKDYLVKIIQLIRGCGFGTAVFSEYTPASTLANIFFEMALCNLLGKPVIIVKSEEAKSPSDFVRTEWVTYAGNKKKQLRLDYSDSVSSVLNLAKYYETLGDLVIDAEDIDLELAFERYRQSFLINGLARVRRKIHDLRDRVRDKNDAAAKMGPARSRIRIAISEFSTFLSNT